MNNEKLELIKERVKKYASPSCCVPGLFVMQYSKGTLDRNMAFLIALESMNKMLEKHKRCAVTNNWLRMHGFRPRRKPH